MKKILFFLAIATLVVSSCGNKKKKDTIGTHTHKGGTVHANDAHSHNNTANLKQEAFEAKTDSNSEYNHKHGENNEHDHDHNEHK